MTSKLPTLSAFLAYLAVAYCPAVAGESYMPQTEVVQLESAIPENGKLGELSYRGGVMIEPGEAKIGELSGLEWWGGAIHAVSKDGRWMIMAPNEFRDELTDIVEIEVGDLLNEKGKRLRSKDGLVADAITRSDTGEWLVTFRGDGRMWRYPSLDGPAQLAEAGRAPANPEFGDGQVTDSDCASTGVCYHILHRPSDGTTTILAVGPDGLQEILASWGTPPTTGDFDGLTVREEGARTYLYLASNGNLTAGERTLLLKFQVSARAAATPGVPEKVFDTVRVVLNTAMGEITVALETERAPITAANFLRYVDEGRYDGTACYRAMQHKQLNEPSGFLQCGTQNDPKRILPPIAHEPTSETGLSHTDGALSMARFDPGTATGDFSIMIKDQRGLDAQPDADDPALRPGFAVFGYVVDGMEVVHAIHTTEIDPNAGEGFLKGQMLAQPVKIVNVRRVELEDPAK